MAGEKVRIDDLFEAEVLAIGKSHEDELEKAKAANKDFANSFEQIKKELKEVISLQSKVSGSKGEKELVGSLKKRTNATNKLSEAEKENLALGKRVQRQQQKLTNARGNEAQKLARLREGTKALNAANRQQAVLTSKLTGAYAKLGARLAIARRRAKDVGAAHGETSDKFKKEARRVRILDKRIKSLDEAVGQHGRKVGQYTNALKGGVIEAKRFASALGIMGGAFLAARIGRDTFNRIREFGRQMNDIAGIIGTTRGDIAGLEEDIKNVASQSIRTSNEVAELAEALVTLGKTKEEIKDLLEPINDLSIALRATPQETGELVVKTLNAYGAQSIEAERYANILANARRSTALNFGRIRDALNYIGPSAASLNMTLEETTAIIGVLVDNGIKASQAGRVMRTAFGRLAKSGITLRDAIKQIEDIDTDNLDMKDLVNSLNAEDPEKQAVALKKLGSAAKLLGQRAGPLALILSKNEEKLKSLTEEFENSDGVLEKFINEQLKSLDSQLKILDSAWEKYLLDVNESTGASSLLKDVIGALASNVKEVIDFVLLAGAAWLSYKAVVRLSRIQTGLAAVQTNLLRINTIAATKSTLLLRLAFRSLGKAISANAIGLTVAVIAGAIAVYKTFHKTINQLEEANQESANGFRKTRIEHKKSADEIEGLIKKYKELEPEAKDNSKAQQSLETVISKLAEKVPDAAKEFDAYGKVIGINTDKVREFTQEQIRLSETIAEAGIVSEKAEIERIKRELETAKIIFQSYQDRKEDTIFGISVVTSDAISKNAQEIQELNKNLAQSKIRIEDYTVAMNKLGDESSALAITRLQETMAELDLTTSGIPDNIKAILEAGKSGGSSSSTISNIQTLNELLKQIRVTRQKIANERRDASREGWDDQDITDIKELEKSLSGLEQLYTTITGETLKAAEANDTATDSAEKNLKAAYALNQYLLKQKIEAQNFIAKQDNLPMDERQDAMASALEAELELQKSIAEQKLESLDDFDKEYLKRLKKNGSLTKEQEKSLDDEQQRIYQQYLNGRLKAYDDFATKLRKSQKDQFDSEKENDLSRIDRQLNQALNVEARDFQKRIGAYKNFREDKEGAVKEYQKRIDIIEIKFQKKRLERQLKFLRAMLPPETEGDNTERNKILSQISEIERVLAELDTDITIGVDIDSSWLDKWKDDWQKAVQEVGRATSDLVGQIQNLGNAQFENRIQSLEQEKEDTNEYYDNILENEELTADERQITEKRKERAAKRTEREIGKEKRKQAEFEKKMSIAQAYINTALGITAAFPNPILMAIIAAAGAIEIAAIKSREIPKYFLGTESHPGGDALVGEFRPEVILEPNKNPYIQDKPEIKKLRRGTSVVPSIDEYHDLMSNQALAGINYDNKKIKQHNSSLQSGRYDEETLAEIRLLRKALDSKKMSLNLIDKKDPLKDELRRLRNTKWG